MTLAFRYLSVGYAGTYDFTGTKINMKVGLEVLKQIVLIRQHEWCDGIEVMDYYYPVDQPITEPGIYDEENLDYSHIPWLLDFNLFGHNYELEFEYRDVETGIVSSVRANVLFFVPTEMIVDLGIAGLALGAIAYFVIA